MNEKYKSFALIFKLKEDANKMKKYEIKIMENC
jgi:hypothetical protein